MVCLKKRPNGIFSSISFRYFIHSIERGFKIVKSIFSTYFARGMYIYPFVNVPTSVVFSGPNVFSNICIASLKSFCNALCNSSAITSIRCFNPKPSTLHVTEDTKFF